ncbi:MAG TPA: thiol reductant ABC exporter subunit CydC [Nakamurella sp.]|nr:thiol reductant ABC exporter subunit CydC [Nakamurella sp.]
MVTEATADTATADTATADTVPAPWPRPPQPYRSPLVRLIGQARGVRGRLLGAAILGGLASGCAVALMATSAWLIARAAQQPPVLYLMVAVVAVRTFGIGRGVLRYLERLVSHDAAFRVLGRMRERLVAHLAVLAPAGLPLWRRGDLLSRMVDDVDDAGDAFLRGLLPLAGAVLVGGGTVVLAVLILPAAGAALAAGLVVACVVAPLMTARWTARTERQVVRQRAQRARLVNEILDDLPELTVLGALDGRMAELDAIENEHQRVTVSTARAAGLATGLAVLSMGAAVWLAARWGVPAVVDADLDPVLLAVIVLTPLALTDVVQAVGFAASTLRRSAASTGRLFAVLDAQPATAPEPLDPLPLPQDPGGPVIAVRGVCARWPGAQRDALTDVDLVLVPGRRTVLLGESGSGKSTLLAVLLGFLTPTAGTITVDGVDVAELDAEAVRGLFGWCDQRAYLFDSSLAENVRLARSGASDQEVAQALRAVGAGDWLDSLPDGLETRVGEHGQAVSGGERQRVALARAVLADRPVLLADEPAAHLDPATADAVTDLIMRPSTERSVLLVTHRASDAVLGDVVLELVDGRCRPVARRAAPLTTTTP